MTYHRSVRAPARVLSLLGRTSAHLVLAMTAAGGASFWSCAAVGALSAASVHAQLTWAPAGNPPPPEYVPTIPLYRYPFIPQHAFWDETRGRVSCNFAITSNGYPISATTSEFDGETWIGAPGLPAPRNRFDCMCADPRGGGRHVLFGGILFNFFFYTLFNDTYTWNPVGRVWVAESPQTRPAPRGGASMALLPGVGAVLFGGQVDGSVFTDETWVWDGRDWRQVQTSPRPSPRSQPAMAFDPIRGELLLFGGASSDETWSFDGTRWLQLNPTNHPSGGYVRQMITDPVRHTVLLFGGTAATPGSLRNDTWTWDGSNWNLRSPAHVPPPRELSVMAWDAASQRVLLLSGYDGGATSLPDTWAWDGTDWTELRLGNRATLVQPPARFDAVLACSEQNNRMVLFGGYRRQGISSLPMNDTWESAGGVWQQRTPSTRPPASYGAAAAMLRGTGALYVVPGTDRFGNPYNAQWVFGSSGQWSSVPLQSAPIAPAHQVLGSLQSSHFAWVLVRLATSGSGLFQTSTLQIIVPGTGTVQTMFPAGGPPPLVGSAMAQAHSPSVALDRVWLFGGSYETIGGPTYTSDVWQLADTGVGGNLAWTLLPPAGMPVPAGRSGAAVAYHPGQNRIYVMGGSAPAMFGDSWYFDVATRTWTQIPGAGPAARHGAAMTYDPAIDRIVLIGGYDGTTVYDDLWECDGASWTQRSTPVRPPARNNASLVHDRANHRSLLFGGYDGRARGDLWTYDGASWAPVVGVGSSPPSRFVHSACFDEANGAMVVFGGTQEGFSSLGDTWRFQAGQWTQGSVGPPPRLNAAMTYAALQGIPRSILFGGYDQGQYRGDGWSYDFATDSWQQLPAGPAARDIHAMAWDRLRNVVVLFGGRDGASAFLDDTWELNLGTATWSLRTPATRPPGRWNHTMAYDEARARTVVVGGYSATGYRNDLWEWNGTDWQERTPESPPPAAHEDAAMAYDPATGKLQLFGGWDGTALRGELFELRARIDPAGPGNTAAPEALRFYSQPVLGQQLKLGFANAQGFGFHTIGFGPLQQPLGPLPVPPMCEPSSFYALLVSYLVLGTTEPNIAWNVPNSPLLLGVTLVFQAFAAQPANCWRATDALHVRF